MIPVSSSSGTGSGSRRGPASAGGVVLAVQADGDQVDVVVGAAVDQPLKNGAAELLQWRVGQLGQGSAEAFHVSVEVRVAVLDEPVGVEQHGGAAFENGHGVGAGAAGEPGEPPCPRRPRCTGSASASRITGAEWERMPTGQPSARCWWVAGAVIGAVSYRVAAPAVTRPCLTEYRRSVDARTSTTP